MSDLHVSVSLRLRLVDVFEEAEEVDTFGKRVAALDKTALHSGTDVGEGLAAGDDFGRSRPDGGALPGGGHGEDAKAANCVHDSV